MNTAAAAAYGLFGREDALSVLSGVLDAGGSALAIGDPGVGKSSLLKVADQLAQRRGRRVLTVSPTQFDRGLPFAGLADLVSQCPDGAELGLPDPQWRALAVALHEAEPEGPELDALAVPLAVRGVLRRVCEAEPVALIIDDLQWLDQPSAGSLGFALRHMGVDPERMSVLVGTRPEAADTDFARGLPGPRHRLRLPPLPESAIGQLLRDRLGPRWTPPMVAGVARASGGNPFLSLMIAEAMESDLSKWHWSSHGEGDAPVFPVPPSLIDILGEKVSLLPPTALEVLLLASAAGRLAVHQLEELLDAEQVRSALDAAADWDVATVGVGSVVRFSHPMLASAIYDAATPAARRHAHRVLADKLKDRVERALHRARTISAPDEAIATDLEQAADISRRRGAPHVAGELLEGAAVATPSQEDTGVSLGRWLGAVDAYIDAGDLVAADLALESASALVGSSEQEAHVLARRMRMTDDSNDYRAIAERAFRLAPKGTRARAESLYFLGEVNRQQGRGKLAWRLSQMAVNESIAVGHPDVQFAALAERMTIELIWGTGQPLKTMAEIERLDVMLTQDTPSGQFAWTSAWVRGFFAPWGDESAERHVRKGISSLVEAGRYGDLSHLYVCLVVVLIRASRVHDAQAALDEADRLGAWAFSSLQETIARLFVGEYVGDLDEVRELAQRAAASARDGGSTYWSSAYLTQLGFIETSARNWSAALDALREAAAIFERTGMVDLEQLLWAVDYADAALQVGALDEVEAAIGFLRRQGELVRPEALVAAARCEALLKAARGELDDALHDLVKIVDKEAAECPFEHARSRLALGQVYRRAGYKGMANQTLVAAADAFETLGIPRWAERARHEAGRVGLFPTTTTLTETERRVAQLVASGMSNHEVAAALFMSVKTVEANLTRIYRKLSVRSRTELANHLSRTENKTAQ